MAKETLAQDLSDFLATRNFDVKYTNQQGRDSSPEDARVMAFDWVSPANRRNYGTAVVVLGEEDDLQLYFGDNLGRGMEDPDDKDAWFAFMKQLKDFGTRHSIGTFTVLDINQLRHNLAGLAAIKEGLFEGYYGTRRVSYHGAATEARLVIRHNRMLGEHDKRYRYVESLFIETAEGERFKLPFTRLAGGRAMLEHVRQGGTPYDARGQHVRGLVEEMNVLARFNRASQGRVFEGATQDLVEAARGYYEQLRHDLAGLATSRGYGAYFENWSPAGISGETQLVEDIKQLFVEQTLDARIEAAVPILARLQQGAKMKEITVFESWINRLSEGTWALPDTPEAQAKLNELMSRELIVGPDATNATEQLYDVVGDDQLFDALSDLARRDPRANIWEDTDVQDRLAELGIQTPQSTATAPADVSQDTAPAAPVPAVAPAARPQAVTETLLMDESGETLDHILDRFRHEVRQFQRNKDLDNNLYDALFDYYTSKGDMPYGVARARTGDPYQWIANELTQHLQLKEADPMATFEMGVTGAAMGGQMAGMGEGRGCNMTAEGEYCPEHGLAECGYMEETLPSHIKKSDLPPGMRTPMTMKDVEAERPQGAFRYRVGEKEFMDLRAAEQFAAGTGQKVELINWAKMGMGESDDPINYNAAITGSYYENQDPLVRLRTLALGRR